MNSIVVQAHDALGKYHRTFYSLCRNVKSFDSINLDKINPIIEDLKPKYKREETGKYYYSLLRKLSNNIFKSYLSAEEALFILINVIDENLNIFEIYEVNCKINDIKNECIENFGFHDDKLIQVEKQYIKHLKKEKEYDFTKKLELK